MTGCMRDKDSIYSIFESAQAEARKLLPRAPMKSSMRDASNERCFSQQQKTVSFRQNMRNSGVEPTPNSLGDNRCITSQPGFEETERSRSQNTGMINPKDSLMSLSPYEKSMANYKATKEMLIEADLKRISERKKDLERMKKERELRNSKIKGMFDSQNMSSSQHKNFGSNCSPNMLDTKNDTLDKSKNTPAANSLEARNVFQSKF